MSRVATIAIAARTIVMLAITSFIAATLGACTRSQPEPRPIATASTQAAYVWQRNWTPAVRGAVAHPPEGIDELRVLIAEVSPARPSSTDDTAPTTASTSGERIALTMMAVDAGSLSASHVPITLVIRIDGSRPIESLSLAPIVAKADRLREAGAIVVGIEIDHDCATARLPDYARWLARERGAIERLDGGLPYRFSITALPTWASSPHLVDVADAVDQIVVQVHAVRAPMIFDANSAWRDLKRFARAVGASPSGRQDVRRREDAIGGARDGVALRVALPTYSAIVRDVEVSVDPDDVSRFVRRLRTEPIAGVGGIVWFRLPVDGDEQTWPRATFARIVANVANATHAHIETAGARAKVELVALGDQRFDVVVSNPTGELVDLPAVHIAGDIGAADMVLGYRAAGPGRWDAPRRSLERNERVVIGWIHGKDISLVE